MMWNMSLASLALSFMADRYYHLVYLVSVFLTSACDLWKPDSSFISVAYWIKKVRSCFQEDEVKATCVLEEESHHQLIRQNNARSTANKIFLRARLTIQLDYRFTMFWSVKDVVMNKVIVAVGWKQKEVKEIALGFKKVIEGNRKTKYNLCKCCKWIFFYPEVINLQHWLFVALQ